MNLLWNLIIENHEHYLFPTMNNEFKKENDSKACHGGQLHEREQ